MVSIETGGIHRRSFRLKSWTFQPLKQGAVEALSKIATAKTIYVFEIYRKIAAGLDRIRFFLRGHLQWVNWR